MGPLRAEDRHRTVQLTRRTGHDHRALRFGPPGVLVGRQRQQPPRPARRRPDASRRPKAQLVQLPVHASWLNQVEIYFSVVQRKVLTRNDFADLGDVE